MSLTNGVVTSISNLTLGTGYQVGEVLTIDNTSALVTGGQGFKMVVKAIDSIFDTLFLTDVQGETFSGTLVHYGAGNETRTVATNVNVKTSAGASSQNGTLFSGNKFQITQYNHAHHSSVNQVQIKDVKPDTTVTQTTQSIAADATVVSIADTTPFASFNGITTHKGEALIGEEIVSYTLGTGSLTITRAQFNTNAFPHPEGTDIQTYEAGGISLVGINTTVSYTHLTLPTKRIV